MGDRGMADREGHFSSGDAVASTPKEKKAVTTCESQLGSSPRRTEERGDLSGSSSTAPTRSSRPRTSSLAADDDWPAEYPPAYEDDWPAEAENTFLDGDDLVADRPRQRRLKQPTAEVVKSRPVGHVPRRKGGKGRHGKRRDKDFDD